MLSINNNSIRGLPIQYFESFSTYRHMLENFNSGLYSYFVL